MQEQKQQEQTTKKKTVSSVSSVSSASSSRNSGVWVVLAFVVILAGVVAFDWFYGGGKIKAFFVQTKTSENTSPSKNTDTGILAQMPLDAGSAASFAVFDEAFLLCTKDGVKYYNSVGDQKWSDTFNMTAPTLVSEGTYTAVGDLNSKNVRVYSVDGLSYQVQLEGSLRQFALNTNGYLSLIEEKDGHYEIKVYNNTGTLLKGRVEESEGIYPVSSDVSDDNRAFAVSYVDTADIYPIGRILFFYVNEKDSENYTDSLFASVDRPDEVIGGISYRSDGTLAAVSDQGAYGLQNNAVVWEYPFTNVLEYVSFQNKEYVVLSFGDAMPGNEGKSDGTVCWLDGKGKEAGTLETGGSVTYLSAWRDGFVVGNDQNYKGVRYSGKEAWQMEATRDVTDAIPMQEFTIVLAVGQEQAMILDMAKYQTQAITIPNADTNTEPTQDATQDETQTTEEAPTEEAPTEGTPTETTQDETQQDTTGTEAEQDTTQQNATQQDAQQGETQNET